MASFFVCLCFNPIKVYPCTGHNYSAYFSVYLLGLISKCVQNDFKTKTKHKHKSSCDVTARYAPFCTASILYQSTDASPACSDSVPAPL